MPILFFRKFLSDFDAVNIFPTGLNHNEHLLILSLCPHLLVFTMASDCLMDDIAWDELSILIEYLFSGKLKLNF